MFKHEMTYLDFNGDERKETFYFHLSVPEATRIETEIKMPIGNYARHLVEQSDIDTLVKFLERIVLTSYGEKSADGRVFKKTQEIRESFEYSQAYAELFEKLLLDQEFALAFGEGIAKGSRPNRQVAAEVAN